MDRRSNVVLIGMPGVGKSTVGVLLAKALSRAFLDTDVVIQAKEGRRLQAIIDEQGTEAFCRLEEQHILALRLSDCVIATGGSVVYSQPAMAHLRTAGVIVHLALPFDELERRLQNLPARGVVMARDQTLRQLYDKRLPLYARYADFTVACSGLNHERVVEAVRRAVDPGAH